MIETQIVGFSPTTVPFDEAWARQRRTHARVVAAEAPPTLLLLEHPAVYTAGSGASAEEYPRDGTPVIPVTRGGKVTWHGPGQLVGYPIFPLPPLSGVGDPIHPASLGRGLVDVVGHVRRLEGVLIRTLREVGVSGVRVPGRSGVWVASPCGSALKIAAIGIRVEKGVSLHGFSLNCTNSLEPYQHFIPCGISDAGVTTLEHEGATRSDVPTIAALLEEHFEEWYRGDPEPLDPQEASA